MSKKKKLKFKESPQNIKKKTNNNKATECQVAKCLSACPYPAGVFHVEKTLFFWLGFALL